MPDWFNWGFALPESYWVSAHRRGMRRRDLLASLGAGVSFLAGCQSVTGDPSTTHSPTASTPQGESACRLPGTRRVSLQNALTLPENAGLEVTTTLEQAHITPDTPGSLTVTVTNTGETRATKFTDTADCHLFNRPHGKSAPAGLWLYRQQNAPTSEMETCWREATKPENTRTYEDYGCARVRFEAGDSFSTTYAVWDDYATEGYLPPDTYRFETTIPLWASTDEDHDAVTRYDWWFELNVTNPES